MPVALHGLPGGGASTTSTTTARAAFLSEVPSARAAFLSDVQDAGVMPDSRRGSAPPRGHGDFLFGADPHTGSADATLKDDHAGLGAAAHHQVDADADHGTPDQAEVNGIVDTEVDDAGDDDLDGGEPDQGEAGDASHDGIPASLPPGMQELMKALAAARDAEATVGRMAASRPAGLAATGGMAENVPRAAGAEGGVAEGHAALPAGTDDEGIGRSGGDAAEPADAEVHSSHGGAAASDWHAASPENMDGSVVYSAQPGGGSMVGTPFGDLPPEMQQELMKALSAARATEPISLGGAAPPDEGGGAKMGDAGAPLRLQEAGLHIDLSGLKALRTAVLVTGGLCSKLFGIGLMGYLAFQSMQANLTRPQQQQQHQRADRQPSQQQQQHGCHSSARGPQA
mmetsp:Transcript_32182/g.85027  ORF Transcript_32182/g.85027 Transcript_32182/m.85027 type:complete len:398 (+) Transcript_32182:67-1260(+)